MDDYKQQLASMQEHEAKMWEKLYHDPMDAAWFELKKVRRPLATPFPPFTPLTPSPPHSRPRSTCAW